MSIEPIYDYEEALSRNTNYKLEDLNVLRKWIDEQEPRSLIPKDVHDKQLLLFYNACHLNLNDTKKCIKMYYTIRNNLPEFFNDRHLEDDLMKDVIQNIHFYIFPDKTDDGSIVFLHRFRNTPPEHFHIIQIMKLMTMMIDAYLYEHGPPNGIIVIFDVEGVRFAHIKRMQFGFMSKYLHYVQEAIPININSIYVLNANPIFHKILSVLRPFFKNDSFHNLKIHVHGDSYEEFFDNCLDKKFIPPDFGGESSTTLILNERNCEKLNSLRHYFDAEEKFRREYKEKVAPETAGKRWFSFLY